jgi:hypothetical protein
VAYLAPYKREPFSLSLKSMYVMGVYTQRSMDMWITHGTELVPDRPGAAGVFLLNLEQYMKGLGKMTCNNFPTTPKKGCDVMQMLPIRTYN